MRMYGLCIVHEYLTVDTNGKCTVVGDSESSQIRPAQIMFSQIGPAWIVFFSDFTSWGGVLSDLTTSGGVF